jgi:hypothetical protein
MTMKYFPKLKVWKNSNGNCTFDGKEAFSYNWYCIALVLDDGRIVVNGHNYSSTTANHINDVRRLLGYDNIIHLTAPRGLKNTEATEKSLLSEIEDIKEKLPRARARKESLMARLQGIEKELQLNKEIAAFLNKEEVTEQEQLAAA